MAWPWRQQRQVLSRVDRQLPNEYSRRPLARVVDKLINDIAGSNPVSKLVKRPGELLAGMFDFAFKPFDTPSESEHAVANRVVDAFKRFGEAPNLGPESF